MNDLKLPESLEELEHGVYVGENPKKLYWYRPSADAKYKHAISFEALRKLAKTNKQNTFDRVEELEKKINYRDGFSLNG